MRSNGNQTRKISRSDYTGRGIRAGESEEVATTLSEARFSPTPWNGLRDEERRNDKALQIRVARQRYPIRELFNKLAAPGCSLIIKLSGDCDVPARAASPSTLRFCPARRSFFDAKHFPAGLIVPIRRSRDAYVRVVLSRDGFAIRSRRPSREKDPRRAIAAKYTCKSYWITERRRISRFLLSPSLALRDLFHGSRMGF